VREGRAQRDYWRTAHPVRVLFSTAFVFCAAAAEAPEG
jgi:hypothetical protein